MKVSVFVDHISNMLANLISQRRKFKFTLT